MKKTVAIFAVMTFVFVTTGFKAVCQSTYGPWKTTSCFQGLDFCVKKGPYNEYAKKYEWWVKFRNRYRENIAFDCVLKESNVSTAKGTDRVNVRAGGEGGSMWFLVADDNNVNLFVNSLRFGNDTGVRHMQNVIIN